MKKSDSCFEEAVITMSCILICQRIGVVLTWLVIFVRRYVLLYCVAWVCSCVYSCFSLQEDFITILNDQFQFWLLSLLHMLSSKHGETYLYYFIKV